MKESDSYPILEQLIQKRLLVLKPAQLVAWLDNLENTGQITEQENKDLLTLAEQLDIYNLPFTEYTFLRLRNDFYMHPSLLSSFFEAILMFFACAMQDLYSSPAGVFESVVILSGLTL